MYSIIFLVILKKNKSIWAQFTGNTSDSENLNLLNRVVIWF